MIEAYANGDDPFDVLDAIEINEKQLFKSQIDEYGHIVDDIGDIMEDYFDYWEGTPEDLRYSRLNGRGAEHEFEIEIDGIIIKGKIDAFARSKGLRWLGEHKTFSRMPTEDHRWRNIQSSIYLRITDILGWPAPDGTVWDYIRSKPPTKPKLLKSGGISTKSVDTLPTVVLAELRRLKVPVSKARGLIDAATKNRTRYFQRIYTPRNDEVIDTLFQEFMDTSHEMSALHGKSKTRSIGRHCEYCDFEGLCRAELLGHDVDFIKEREYTTEKENAPKADETNERHED